MNYLTSVWGIPTSKDFYCEVGTRLELTLEVLSFLPGVFLSDMRVGFLAKLDSLNSYFCKSYGSIGSYSYSNGVCSSKAFLSG